MQKTDEKSPNNSSLNRLNFYQRAREEYTNSNTRPFLYELDLVSPKPKPKAAKFIIILKKFMDLYRNGIKPEYEREDSSQNYWTQLTDRYKELYEMRFIKGVYRQKPKSMLQKFIAILIHTKNVFKILEEIVWSMEYIYVDHEQKKKQFMEDVKLVDFLLDGEYKIMGSLLNQYDSFYDEAKAKDLLEQRQQQLNQKKVIAEIPVVESKSNEKQKQEEEELLEKQKKLQQLSKSTPPRITDSLLPPEFYPEQYVGQHEEIKTPEKQKPLAEIQIPMKGRKEKKVKNSQKLYIERFKDEQQTFSYKLKPEKSEKKQKCFQCGKDLKSGFYIFGGNQNYCEYTGQWYCNEDISDERMPIPWRAMESFDLRGYTVCKTAHAQLRSYYEKPLLEIPRNSILIKNPTLYEFLILKRQVHLIYDSICNLDLIQPLMKRKLNYCLKINLFSMKNLYDIYNGQETPILKRDYEILSRHFYRCEVCQKRRGYICPACKNPVKIFVFQLRETQGCEKCRKLYHRRCFLKDGCACAE